MKATATAVVLCLITLPAWAREESGQTTGEQKAQDQGTPEAPPPHVHIGWKSLFKDSARDFVAFPSASLPGRCWPSGGGAALAAHPLDDYVETHIVGNHAADHIFILGKWIGRAEVQMGTAVALWAVGRSVVAPAADESQTNKYSELGFDLIRAQFLTQALVHGVKYSVRRDRPTGECCAFPSGHAATAFATASVLERHFGSALAGRRSSGPPTWRRRGWSTTATSSAT